MTSGRYRSEALDLRLELQLKLRRDIARTEIADEVQRVLSEWGTSRNIDSRTIGRIEENDMERADLEVLSALASYYLRQGLEGSRVLRFTVDGETQGARAANSQAAVSMLA